MQLARIDTAQGPRACIAEGDDWVVVSDVFASAIEVTSERYPRSSARLLAPVEPRILLGMLHNSGPADRTLAPQAFHKSTRTVVGPGVPILLDPRRGAVKGEAELAIVIGRLCRDVAVADAASVILGWTVANDVTAVQQVALDDTRTQAKNGDGFTPLGPWIETDLDPLVQGLAASVDGIEVASSTTSELAWNPYELVAYLTSHLTLGPGDVILTGAPGTAFDIVPGNVAGCTVAGIGTLSNPVRSRVLTEGAS